MRVYYDLSGNVWFQEILFCNGLLKNQYETDTRHETTCIVCTAFLLIVLHHERKTNTFKKPDTPRPHICKVAVDLLRFPDFILYPFKHRRSYIHMTSFASERAMSRLYSGMYLHFLPEAPERISLWFCFISDQIKSAQPVELEVPQCLYKVSEFDNTFVLMLLLVRGRKYSHPEAKPIENRDHVPLQHCSPFIDSSLKARCSENILGATNWFWFVFFFFSWWDLFFLSPPSPSPFPCEEKEQVADSFTKLNFLWLSRKSHTRFNFKQFLSQSSPKTVMIQTRNSKA